MVFFWHHDVLGGKFEDTRSFAITRYEILRPRGVVKDTLQDSNSSRATSLTSRYRSTARPPPPPHSLSSSKSKVKKGYFRTFGHQCDHFAFPPPPPANRRRTGPRRKSCFFIWPFFQFLIHKL